MRNMTTIFSSRAGSPGVGHGGYLAGSSLLALALFAAVPAHAQTAANPPADAPAADGVESEEIRVTGIRAQIESSQNIKRNSDTFVDAITSDDIGALPDKSVTEALQRVPGVTINRFQGQDDPLHFSVEGSNVVIRGLTFVRSEFNGRDAFSVNTGRSLGFSDVSPELLASVEVLKNGTPDRIEGGIAGVVNLRTRKPFDSRKLIVAGTVEGLYGDITEKLTPAFSALVSNVFETGIGDVGVLFSYGQSRLKSTSFGTQLDEYQYRPDLSPAGEQVYVPRGAGVRTQEFDRFRNTFDASLQWEAVDGSAKLTLEYIRAVAKQDWGENTAELDNFNRPNDTNRTTSIAGSPFVYDDDGILLSGGILNPGGLSPLVVTHRNQKTRSENEDFSANLELNPTENLSFVFDGQYARAGTRQFDIGLLGSVDTDVAAIIDRGNGLIPDLQFVAPNVADSAAFLADPNNVFYRAVLDHIEESDGDEIAFRADGKYEFDEGFLKALRFGGRYTDRQQTRRYTAYAWGFISQNWTGAGLSPYSSPNPVGTIESYNFPNFQRGQVATPINTLYTTLNLASAYASGEFQQLVTGQLRPGCCAGNAARFLVGRDGVIPGTPYLPSEINESREQSFAAYGRIDFGFDNILGDNTALNGNFGVRFVDTIFETAGSQTAGLGDTTLQFPNAAGVATVVPTAAQIAARCTIIVGGGQVPDYCALSPAQQQTFFTFLNGSSFPIIAENRYSDWLPSFNANLRIGDDFFIRFAVQEAISRPDFGTTSLSIGIGGNNLATAANGLAIFSSGSGNPSLGSIKSVNYDLGFEYYFGRSSSVTLNLFYKTLSDLIGPGGEDVLLTSNGLTEVVSFNSSANVGKGKIKGLELGYSQFYDFLPGALGGFGLQGNFTYVDTSTFDSAVNNESTYAGLSLPLQNLSKYTFNASLLYEKYGISARASYNWRSQYLLTPRDVIIPFAPIYVPDGGQLDASLFYEITRNIKIGVQGQNLLNQTTRTLQQLTYDADGNFVGSADYTAVEGPLAPRSFFQNDRRYSVSLRFNF